VIEYRSLHPPSLSNCRMTPVREGPRFSAAPTALRLPLGLVPSPSGLGSRLVAGPPGLASMAICNVIPLLTRQSESSARGDKRDSGTHLSSRYPWIEGVLVSHISRKTSGTRPSSGDGRVGAILLGGFVFVAYVQAEFGCRVCAGYFHRDFCSCSVFVKEGINYFQAQALPARGHHLR